MSNTSDFIIENGVLTKYVGPGGDVVIPEEVEKIGEQAFQTCETLTSVVMGQGVKVIGFSAFSWCRNLKSVEIGPRVSEIGLFAFSNCNGLSSITIPESVEVIDIQAFGEISFKEVLILGSQTKINSSAFNGMCNWSLLCAPNLSFELLPKTLKYNAALGFLHLWSEGSNISQEIALEYENYIKRIKKKLIDEYIFYSQKVHALQYIAQHKMIKKTEIDDLIEKAQKIGNIEMTSILMAYLNEHFGTGFEKLVEREDAKEKETAAQKKAKEKVATARKDPKTDFKRLWNVKKLPDGTCKISAYKGVLEELVFPKEIDGCPISEIGARDNTLANEEGFNALRRVVLPPSLRAIGRNFFSSSSLEEITIPEGVTKIEKELFAYCKSLKKIKLPTTLETITPSAFIFCENLETINIPKKIDKVTREMFNSSFSGGGCGKLKKISIEGKFTKIEDRVFDQCLHVKNVISYRNEKGILCERAECEYSVTIHAPSGSYAETYAKENNIPYVAE